MDPLDQWGKKPMKLYRVEVTERGQLRYYRKPGGGVTVREVALKKPK